MTRLERYLAGMSWPLFIHCIFMAGMTLYLLAQIVMFTGLSHYDRAPKHFMGVHRP